MTSVQGLNSITGGKYLKSTHACGFIRGLPISIVGNARSTRKINNVLPTMG